jgi:protoporphyrinogen oxidase
MKIAVIGAGISGLSFAKYAKSKNMNVKIFEKSDCFGGIAKVKDISGIPYHMIGGHCFNSKFEHVKKFVFENVLPESEWNLIQRHASILFKGNRVSYPIEYSIKDIFSFDQELGLNIVKDYYKASKKPADDLAGWFINNFGKTLAEEYFIPYNRKIWGAEPSEMTPDWVTDKLPMPSDMEILKGLIGSGSDSMPHSSFYYPKSGSQNTFINALADGLDIKFNVDIGKVNKNDDGKYLIDGGLFDHVIYTGPLNKIGSFVEIESDVVNESIAKLKYNKVTTVLWKSKKTEDTWTYIPGDDCIFHRLIHIGNFIGSAQNYSISEAVGEVTYQDMIESGKNVEQLIEPIDYNVSEHAYVVFDKDIAASKSIIFDYFDNENIHLLGRFGEWEYYNMDICIKRAIEVYENIVSGE